MEHNSEERRVSVALDHFERGYNCAQAVAVAFADRYGLSPELATRLTASYGGGIGRLRQTCGTALAIFMLAGLEHTRGATPDEGELPRHYERVRGLAQEFERRNGALKCADLLDLRKQANEAKKQGVTLAAPLSLAKPCAGIVAEACRIYQQHLDSHGER